MAVPALQDPNEVLLLIVADTVYMLHDDATRLISG